MTNDAFVRHYTAVADASPVPVLLYNFTAVTGVNLPPAAVATLSRASEHRRHEGVGRRRRADRRSRRRARRTTSASSPASAATFYRGAVRRRRRRHPRAGVRAAGAVRAAVRADAEPARHDEARALQRQLVPVARLLGAHARRAGLKAALKLARLRRRRAAAAARCRVPEAVDRRAARSARARSRRSRRMSLLPEYDRILLGPGPSLTSPRVMRAMAAPTVSHLDPLMMALLDDVRARLTRLFRAPEGSFAFAVSGTGTSGHGNGRREHSSSRARARTVVVTGYFGDRLAQMCERYGATVTRVNGEWGRACDPDALEKSLAATPADVVAMVHAETSTGVLNPVRELAAHRARARRADDRRRGHVVRRRAARRRRVGHRRLLQLHAEMPRRAVRAGADRLRAARARAAREVPQLLLRSARCCEDYWLRRKYHHTMSSALVCALYEALTIVEEEGLEARWARHERNHRAFVDGAGGDRPVAAAARRRAAVDAQHRPHPGRRGRRRGAQAAARGVQHRDRRRPRSAGRQDLARRPDGRQLVAAAGRAVSRSTATCAGQAARQRLM